MSHAARSPRFSLVLYKETRFGGLLQSFAPTRFKARTPRGMQEARFSSALWSCRWLRLLPLFPVGLSYSLLFNRARGFLPFQFLASPPDKRESSSCFLLTMSPFLFGLLVPPRRELATPQFVEESCCSKCTSAQTRE